MDSGILQGMAYGIGRPLYVYCSKDQRYQNGTVIDYLNAMIKYSAPQLVRSFADLQAAYFQKVAQYGGNH